MHIVAALFLILCLALAAFLTPAWGAYAVLGLASGWILRVIIRKLRESGSFRIVFGAAMLILISVGSSIWFLTSDERRISVNLNVVGPLELEVSYTGVISSRPSPDPWEILEELVVSRNAWLHVMRDPKPQLSSRLTTELAQLGAHELAKQNWIPKGLTGSFQRFERSRKVLAPARWFPATTTVTVSTKIATIQLGRAVRLIPDRNSKVVIRSSKYAIGSTFPPYSTREDVLGSDEERMTVPLTLSRLEEQELRLELLSPLLRWRFGPQIGRLSLWSGIEWVLLAVCFVFSEQIKENILKPPIARLIRRRGTRGEREPHQAAVVAKPTHSEDDA